MCTEKSSPASCAPVTERQFAPRNRARPVRQGCCPLARLAPPNPRGNALQWLALRRVFRQGLLPCLPEECVVLKILLRLVQRFVRSPWNAAVAWRCELPDSVYPRPRASELTKSRRTPARSDSTTPWPAFCKRSAAGSSTPRPPSNFCAAAALREGSTTILTAVWQTRSQLRGFSPSSPRA